jgi:hypothetical protein
MSEPVKHNCHAASPLLRGGALLRGPAFNGRVQGFIPLFASVFILPKLAVVGLVNLHSITWLLAILRSEQLITYTGLRWMSIFGGLGRVVATSSGMFFLADTIPS